MFIEKKKIWPPLYRKRDFESIDIARLTGSTASSGVAGQHRGADRGSVFTE